MKYRIEQWADLELLLEQPECSKLDELAELVRYLNKRYEISLPLEVSKRERPDFELSMERGNRNIGLELTWAANAAWEEASQHMRNKRNPGYGTISRNWLEGEASRGIELGSRISDMQCDTTVWHSGDHARAKASEVISAIDTKAAKFNDNKYEKFQENWLLISDRLPFLLLDVQCFEERVKAYQCSVPPSFSKVLFLTNLCDSGRTRVLDVLIEISPTGCVLVGYS